MQKQPDMSVLVLTAAAVSACCISRNHGCNRQTKTPAIEEKLDELQNRAHREECIRKALLETQKEKNPVDAFCRKCQELGYPIYVMDLIHAGEEFYGNMRRSTNGGGENSPKLDGEDDFYELFMASLR